MANVLNPETESITLNTELETPTLEPETELEQPSHESTSNPDTAEAVEVLELDADTLSTKSEEPVAEDAPISAPEAVHTAPQSEHAFATESMDDFSAALEAFEREQAAEAAAVEAYGDKIVSGTVVKQTDKHLVIDLGLKSEGLVPLEQVVDHTGAVKFQPGEVIDVVIEREEADSGYIVSYERAQRLRVWDTIEKAAADKTPVIGTVVSRVKGGLTVDIGIKAFLPGSQLEIRPVRNLDGYLGQQIEVRVIKLNKKRGNVVVSRKELLEEELNSKRTVTMEQLFEGAVLTGTVKNLTDYGAFVDLGGIDGLLHVTDMSYKRVNHPSEVIAIGDEVKVQIVRINQDTQRISLGMKQLESDPWDGVAAKYPVGAKLRGTVTNITEYGAFVELEAGIEGLVHVSEMSWTKKNVHPGKIVSTSQEVDVLVLEVDSDKRRISLGLKQAQQNPWEAFAEKHPVGTVVEGEVKNATEFGLFIGLDGDVDGMVHMSDIAWGISGEDALALHRKGESVQAVVLGVEVDKERISLGMKQLEKGAPSAAGAASGGNLRRGEIVTVTVLEVRDGGLEVQAGEDGATGFIKRSDLGRDRDEQRPDRFQVGQKLDAMVTGFDRSKKPSFSVKAHQLAEEKQAVEQYGSSDAGASLGDILGAALRNST